MEAKKPFVVDIPRQIPEKMIFPKAKPIAFLLMLIGLVCLAAWNFKIQLNVASLEETIKEFKKVSLTQVSTDYTGKEILMRKTRNNGQHFEFIHLEADDGGHPLGRPKAIDLKQNANVNNWKIRDKTHGLHYDKNTGKITVTQDGYYRIYGQIRLNQNMHLSTFVTYSFHVNGNYVATALWYTVNLTQSLSTVVKLKKNDEVSLHIGAYSTPLKCYCKQRYTYFGLYFISP